MLIYAGGMHRAVQVLGRDCAKETARKEQYRRTADDAFQWQRQ